LSLKRTIILALTSLALAAVATAQNVPESLFSDMKWRLIGPYRGGRAEAVTGIPGDPKTYFLGGAAGGLWKSTDGGGNWVPLTDKQPLSSIGAVAVADSDPNVIYIGTGEGCIRGNLTSGDGVYKSMDGGRTWRNTGLRDSRQIGALIIHPRDPNIVFVAALGHVYGPNAERGLFRTLDGGRTWEKVLSKNDHTGAIDVVFDPKNPSILFAALWEVNRTPWSLTSGGDGSGLYRSTDGGTTWNNDITLTSNNEWLQRIRFANGKNGVILDLADGNAQYTTDGGATASDWTTIVNNPDGGWFGLQFSLLPNLHARASGVNFCTSLNSGAQWTCGPSVDSVFDGPVLFQGDTFGWVGGGEISPAVEGWVHVTTNGGKTWSARTLDGPWPIRQFVFITNKMGWAAGGNLYTGVGGIYFTNDGGQTWSVDADTGAEMDACDKRTLKVGHQVWCAGYDGSLNGVIYSAVTQ